MLSKIKRIVKRVLFGKSKNKTPNFGARGENVYIPDDLIIAGAENISLGSNVSFGPRSLIYTTRATLSIGSHVMFGPEVMIITGDHRIDIQGMYMDEVTNEMKLPENDRPVVIEDDCWIGARVTILKGVTIHTGCVIAAGAVVLKDVPEYSIYYGKNEIRPRFPGGGIMLPILLVHKLKITDKAS